MLFMNAVAYNQCNENISTHPNNPVNSQLPDINQNTEEPDEPFEIDERYLNGFNWWIPNEYSTEPSMEFNPGEPYPNIVNIQYPSIQHYYSYLNKHEGREEMNPSNGWELLLVNLGRFPDNVTPLSETAFSSIPYIVLYNKYRGIVRVFVQYGRNSAPSDAVDGVKMTLYYIDPFNNQSNVSGVLRLGSGSDRTLDQHTEVINMTTIAPTNGQSNFWMSGDFQVSYDPCVCWYPSNLNLGFEFFKESELRLIGRGITTTEDLVDDNGNVIDHPFFGSMNFNDNTDDASEGYILYKQMNSLVDDYIKRVKAHKEALDLVNRHNHQVEWNLLMLEIFKIFVTSGKSAASSSTKMQTLKLLTPEFAFNYSSSTTDTKKEDNKLGKFLGEITTIFGKNAEFLEFDAFTKKAIPEAPVSPVASFTETHFSGKMTERSLANGPYFSTPGSFKNLENEYHAPTTEYSYPVYNEALGIFALLEKPKVVIAEVLGQDKYCFEEENVATMNKPNGSTPYQLSATNERWANTIQIQLKEDLKYTLNPALDYKNIDIEAWFEIDTRIESDFPTNDLAQWEEPSYAPWPMNWWEKPRNWPERNLNVKSDIIDVLDYNEIIPEVEVVSMIPFQISYLTHKLSSVSLPINAFKTYPISFSIQNNFKRYYGHLGTSLPGCNYELNESNEYSWTEIMEYGHKLSVRKLELKIKVMIEFDSMRDDMISPNETVQVFTYEIDLNDNESVDYQNTSLHEFLYAGVHLDKGLHKKDLIINEDIHFNGSEIPNCILNNNFNRYTCLAYNSIEIDANISVEPGYSVKFESGNQIIVNPESVISPHVTLEIQEFLTIDEDSNPMPPVEADYVHDFCRGLLDNNRYRANSRPGMPTAEGDSILVAEAQEETFAFNIFPNPTNGRTTASVTLDESGTGELFITDISGRKLGVVLNNEMMRAGENTYQLPTETLNSGIYLIHLYVNGEHHVKRLVKN